MTNLFLMGDASDGSANGETNDRVNGWSGYGRMFLHYPSASDPDIAAPWGWGWRSFVIYPGQTIQWTIGDAGPEPAGITEWKWAFMWTEMDTEATSDIIIDVVDTCTGNGVVASDLSYSLRKRIRLSGATMAGKCLVMKATAIDVPPAGVRVYSADYFHGGSTDVH